ncbi:LysR family transcriptional regulator [Lactiplantibacillus modestisalitolerans]|uniref:LysR family transcriptional regulator n=1 Tax=Lactiplantibacillus modestisalitolerans TaxID=1457219 RepID=A0ABV5WV29_9LACO|nr:LysR family transcriptional regulator [Lactiplantibacillus modestisalitolerans]
MPQPSSINMLRFLDALLKHGNFTRAARDLYISQPYLTQTIQRTEQKLGVAIINRDRSPLALTAAGRVYYQYLTTLESEKDRFAKQLSQYTTPTNNVVRVGVLASLGYYLLPLVLPTYLARHPQLHLELTEDTAERNEQRLLHGELDFLFGQNPETVAPGLTVRDRGQDGYYAIIPKTSPLYRANQATLEADSLSMRQLLQAPLLVSPRGSSIRRQVDYLLQKFKIEPQIVLESTNTLTIAKLAQQGLGITLLPDSVHVALQPDAYNLYPLPLDVVSLNYFIAYPTDKPLNAVEQDLVTVFLAQLTAALKH